MEQAIKTLRSGVKMNFDGVECNVEINLCSFMRPNAPLQIHVRIASHRQSGGVYYRNKNLNVETATEADVAKMLDEVKIGKCSCCGGPRLIDHEVSNRGELCENCFMTQLDKESEVSHQKEEQRFAKECAKQKKAGMTHHITFSVYNGGSDRIYTMFTHGSEESVKAMIQKKYRGQIDFGKFEQL